MARNLLTPDYSCSDPLDGEGCEWWSWDGDCFLELMNVKLGFQAEHRTTAILTLPALQCRTLEQAAKLYDSVIDRVASIAGVQSAAVTDILPLSGNDNRAGAQVEEYHPRPDEHIRMNPRLVTPGYLETMGIPVRAGRMFSASDAAS